MLLYAGQAAGLRLCSHRQVGHGQLGAPERSVRGQEKVKEASIGAKTRLLVLSKLATGLLS